MITANIEKIKQQLPPHVKLIVVSKTRPVEMLMEAYEAGQRAFGENKVQEMVAKQPLLPADTEWHLIGHLQSNKVKYIAPFVHLIHSVDSVKLLETINKEATKNNRIIHCLLQVHIAEEETKFGLNSGELFDLLSYNSTNNLDHVCICGLMGMATNTGNEQQIEKEFTSLKNLFDELAGSSLIDPSLFTTLSMGMSSDY
ncbi:MAG: YggS family pyridoxal phosphate-dependent enzyme, partial [Bacteroidota bacterium]